LVTLKIRLLVREEIYLPGNNSVSGTKGLIYNIPKRCTGGCPSSGKIPLLRPTNLEGARNWIKEKGVLHTEKDGKNSSGNIVRYLRRRLYGVLRKGYYQALTK